MLWGCHGLTPLVPETALTQGFSMAISTDGRSQDASRSAILPGPTLPPRLAVPLPSVTGSQWRASLRRTSRVFSVEPRAINRSYDVARFRPLLQLPRALSKMSNILVGVVQMDKKLSAPPPFTEWRGTI